MFPISSTYFLHFLGNQTEEWDQETERKALTDLGRIDFGEALDDIEDSVDDLFSGEMIVAVGRHRSYGAEEAQLRPN